MNRTFKFRLYPTVRQAYALELQLSEACRLYNAALQERRDAWRMRREHVTFKAQDAQLKAIRAAGDIGIAAAATASSVLRRVDRAFAAFFRRVKSGDRPGYPRFRSSRRFDSLEFRVGHGATFRGGRVRLLGIGLVRVLEHRPLVGRCLRVIVKREAGHWYACCVVECQSDPLPPSREAVGIDVGLSAFASFSTGEHVENPRHYRQAERRLRVARRRVSRRKKGSQRRRKAARLLERAHVRIRNMRGDFHHQLSRRLVNHYGVIAVENLNVHGLARTRMAKSVHDAAWSAFIDKLTYKAESAGRELVKVDPRGTSQTCLCGARVFKRLGDRWHVCTACGLEGDRDHVAAQVILQRARMEPSGVNVEVGPHA